MIRPRFGAAFASGAALVALGALAPSAVAAPAPREAPLLDIEKGERALVAYVQFRRDLCIELGTKRGDKKAVAARLKEVGLSEADPRRICIDLPKDQIGKAIASGSLLDAGADEVLLAVSTALSAETGSSLVVMRDAGKGYAFVRHMLDAARFEPQLRLVASGRADVLFMCAHRRFGGVYSGTCGFFGLGSFRDPPTRAGTRDELSVVDTRELCGPFASVTRGRVTARDDRLLVGLVVEEGELVRAPKDRRDDCSKRTTSRRRRFSAAYTFDGASYRLAPLPRDAAAEIKAVLDRQ